MRNNFDWLVFDERLSEERYSSKNIQIECEVEDNKNNVY